MSLSDAAVRVLQTIADGNTVTGIRTDLYKELTDAGLVGPDVPALPNFVLTPKGKATLQELGYG